MNIINLKKGRITSFFLITFILVPYFTTYITFEQNLYNLGFFNSENLNSGTNLFEKNSDFTTLGNSKEKITGIGELNVDE